MSRLPLQLTLTLVTILSACSPNQQDSRAGKRGGGGATTDCGASLRLQGGSTAGSGSISFSLSDNSDPCSVDGYVVGSQDSSSVERTGERTYVINDVGEGEQDFIVTGTTSADSGRDTTDPTNISGANLDEPMAVAGTLVGLRVNAVRVESGLTSDKTIRLSAVGNIVGSVKLSGQTDHTGIDVYIPGTRYLAKSDASGAYRLDNVPPGTHNLRFEYTGYGSAALEGVELQTAGTTTAPEMLLVTGSGEGKINLLNAQGAVIEGDIPTVTSRAVKFLLQVSGAPKLMKVAEDGNFANLEWQPFRSIGSYVFKNDIAQGGRVTRKLSIRTLEGATEGELEKSLVIDLYPEVRGQEVMTVSALDENDAPSLTITAKITAPKNAVEMRTSLREDFVGASWKPVSESVSIKTTEEGDYTFYLQFRSVDLVASDVYASPVTVDLFPNGSVTFAISSPVARFPANPTFALSSIVSPLVGTNVKLLVANNPAMTAATEYAYGVSASHSLGGKAEACGSSKLYLAPVYVDPSTARRYISDVRPVVEITYECLRSFAAFPAPAGSNAAIAYGSGKLFAWSGEVGSYTIDYGYVLDVSTGVWTAIDTTGQPTGRRFASAWPWNGKFVVFGGTDDGGDDPWSGGIYDPTTRVWTSIPAPSPVTDVDIDGDDDTDCDTIDEQIYGAPYFTGNHIVLWGDQSDGTSDCLGRSLGYVFDLNAQTWSTMPIDPDLVAAPALSPAIRCQDESDHPAATVAAGKLFIYSGLDCDTGDPLLDGWVYDPAANTWAEISTTNQPTARVDHVQAVSGNLVYVWGGRTTGTPSTALASGAVYDMSNDSWTTMDDAPTSVGITPDTPLVPGSFAPIAGIVGTKLIVWSGFQGNQKRWQGLVYDPTASGSKWSTISLTDAPRYISSVIEREDSNDRITGDDALIANNKLYVWSRAASGAELNNLTINLFSVYDPATNTWSQIPTGKNQIASGFEHSLYRNFPFVTSTTDGILFYGGTTPRSVPSDEIQQATAILHYTN